MFVKFRKQEFWTPFVMALAVVVLITGLVPFTYAQDPAPATVLSTDQLFSQIYAQVSPSVVAIRVTGVTDEFGNQTGGLGSGFVLDTSGHIITNNHVVDGASDIEVDFADGTLARAEVVGLDPDSDLAVIKVNVSPEKLHPVTFADSDEIFVGQTVLAIGSPFGERWTLTSGIVSGLDRVIHSLGDFSISGVIQTDAAINPGNSGGPLLNLNGQVIGVNSQIATGTGSNSGVGFAVPSNLVARVARSLIDQGYVEYSYLGMTGGEVSLDLIDALNMANDVRGVVVAQVRAGTPAEAAGLKSADIQTRNGTLNVNSVDIITAIDGHILYTMEDLISYLARNTAPGQTVTLSVLRDGQQQLQLDVHLTARP